MLKQTVLTIYTFAALIGSALAQGAPGGAGTGGSTSTQSVPGWGGQGAPTGPGGLIAVNPTTVVVTYYAAQPADTLASRLLDATVYNTQNEKVGEIEDLLIGQGQNIAGIVIGVGGFLGIGERYVSVPPSSVVLTPQDDRSYRAVINATRDSLRNAPELKFEGNQSR